MFSYVFVSSNFGMSAKTHPHSIHYIFLNFLDTFLLEKCMTKNGRFYVFTILDHHRIEYLVTTILYFPYKLLSVFNVFGTI